MRFWRHVTFATKFLLLITLSLHKSQASEVNNQIALLPTTIDQSKQTNKIESVTFQQKSNQETEDKLLIDLTPTNTLAQPEQRQDQLPSSDFSKGITFGLHLYSLHTAPGFNDHNQGLYLELRNHITLGHYYNSNYKETTYAGYTYSITNHIDLTLALFTGYQIYRYAPLIVPTYKFPNVVESFNLRLAFIPKISNVINANVLHAMIERNF